jgi:hypothetical protein
VVPVRGRGLDPFIRSPFAKIRQYWFVQVQLPAFSKRQVFTNSSPGRSSVPSGMVMSSTYSKALVQLASVAVGPAVVVGSGVGVSVGVITVIGGVGGTCVAACVGRLVGNGFTGGVLVGIAADVCAAWVKTEPGFWVGPPVTGMLHAAKMMLRTINNGNLSSGFRFIILSLVRIEALAGSF